MARDGFIFYESFYDATKCLPDQTKLEAYRLLFEYALYGVEPESDDAIAVGFFKLMRPQIDANNKRRENGCKGGKKDTEAEPNDNQTSTKPEPNDNQSLTEAEPNPNQTVTKPEPNNNQSMTKEGAKEKDKVKDKDKDKDKVKDKDKEREYGFRPPSIDEVRRYCLERGNNINPEQFIDFYSAKGWFVGKNKMKDWQAAIRTWERRKDDSLFKSPSTIKHNNKKCQYNEIYDKY